MPLNNLFPPSSAASPLARPISTRFFASGNGFLNVGGGGGLANINFRKRFVVRARVTNPRIIIPAFYVNTGGAGESITGANITVKGCGLEVAGTTLKWTFSGSASGLVPVGGSLQYLVSDPLPNIVLAAGTVVFARGSLSSASGMPYQSGPGDGGAQNNPGGECFEYSASALPDRSGGTGPFAGSDTSNSWAPLLVGDGDAPALIFEGDSTFAGIKDSITDDSANQGLTRALAQFYGSFNMGVPSGTAGGFVASPRANRTALANAYGTHLIQGHGLNMLGMTLAGIQSDLASERALFPGLLAYLTTTPPSGSTTDGGATVANQTPGQYENTRLAKNAWCRSGPEGWSGCIDIADVIEVNSAGVKTRDGGRYPAGMSSDMLHPSPAGYLLVKAAGGYLRASIGG